MANYFPLSVSSTAVSARTRTEPRPGFFRRLVASMMEARQRAADRAIANYIGATGFTDSVETEIERRFLSNRRDHT